MKTEFVLYKVYKNGAKKKMWSNSNFTDFMRDAYTDVSIYYANNDGTRKAYFMAKISTNGTTFTDFGRFDWKFNPFTSGYDVFWVPAPLRLLRDYNLIDVRFVSK